MGYLYKKLEKIPKRWGFYSSDPFVSGGWEPCPQPSHTLCILFFTACQIYLELLLNNNRKYLFATIIHAVSTVKGILGASLKARPHQIFKTV